VAREKDITRTIKFFVRKKNCNEEELCEVCRHHKILLMVRLGCDGLIYSDPRVRGFPLLRRLYRSGRVIHGWCFSSADPPKCIAQYREAGALR
jgi:hypothetical protein